MLPLSSRDSAADCHIRHDVKWVQIMVGHTAHELLINVASSIYTLSTLLVTHQKLLDPFKTSCMLLSTCRGSQSSLTSLLSCLFLLLAQFALTFQKLHPSTKHQARCQRDANHHHQRSNLESRALTRPLMERVSMLVKTSPRTI